MRDISTTSGLLYLKKIIKEGKIYDERGQELPYGMLPFSPLVIGSTKIVEGDFDDCLKMYITDLEEQHKYKAWAMC
ncbi:MAG: hypothetical protein PHX08_13225 [Lachnospiraceae bacterium]|nr:hypothetical protein [Lachnospiraceae bacterium]